MRKAVTSRSSIARALLLGLLAGWSGVVFAQGQPAPIERQPPPTAGMEQPGGQRHLVGPDGRRGGEHLPEWMEQHRGMTLEQQQEALDREPGFRELPVQTQMQMHQRLAQLNAMTPEMRARTLAHTEAMERLNPAQRSQVRGVMQQLGSLPPDQRRQVIRSFRDLRMLPPGERMGIVNSPRYGWMNYQQHTVLINLIVIAPMLPMD